jgi:D-alanyl-D-alanine carboxypeptidase
MMGGVKSRGWDVGRTVAATVVAMAALGACGQPRLASQPEPEFTSGQRAEPTVVAQESGGTEGLEILPDDIEPDADQPVDVGQMMLVDDAGVAAPNATGWAAFDEYLDRRLVPADVSASVAVMVDGQLVHAAAFGERVAGSGDAVDTTDRFRIASISKTITAIVTMQLVEDGTLTLDEPIGDVLVRQLGLTTYDRDVDSLTVRQLLSHTSGFPQHESTFFSNGAVSCPDAAAQGLSSGVRSGNGFDYSNMNYCVLGLLIEAVTGKTYERIVDERLFTPLGIDGMRMTSTYELGPDEVSHHPTPGRNFMETLGAAGSWNATPADLVTLLNSIDPTTPGWKAVSADTARSMRYRVPVATPPGGYGLGLINYENGFGHTGTIQNTHAMVLVQDDGVTWALTVSGDYPTDTPQLRSIISGAFASAFNGS